ncbi:uncharacterized protein LOC112521636 [Cynara cardunculus var. scolymus]|uniref:MORN motif-containing protein n=1 Tax=Cynara cardunculus var. scolymus TaxID=59895 RepID=A0A118JTF6_CYNCS|nr:uncharacterized protein LOC112521636 [Cynara cardunculus var. scolymus]KVH89754.1 MORN motif-containing protein [Cynara cardunculus var. scolymus]
MRHKKSGLQIGEQQLSSDLKTPQFPFHDNPNFKSYKLRISHLRIQIPTNLDDFKESPSTSNPTNNPPENRHLLMNPQRKTHNHQGETCHLKPPVCCTSSEAFLATKEIALKLLKFTYLKLFWIKLPPRVLIILCLPPIYFFSLNHYRSLYLYILFVIAFCGLLLSSFNLNSLHASNIPSIRPYIARNFPFLKLSKSDKASKTNPPVVWSIGSKTRFEEHTTSGFLVKVYSNGDVYEGEFYKGKCSGSGVYYYNLNGRYEGDWVDQKYDGYGVETWAKGSRYRGQYRQGLRHGYGIYRFYTGDMYAGEWFKGQCHGCGVHSCEDGSKYCGEFKGGVKHGLGHYRFRNGDTYAGEYFADKMHGFGVYHFANGHRYEGAWHEGRRQGVGSYTFRNGDTQSGHWENGVLGVSASEDAFLPESSTSVSQARVLKAVQDARYIAEKAVGVAEVDERVNRAITAANRAANAARVAAVKAVQNQVQHHDETGDLSLPII